MAFSAPTGRRGTVLYEPICRAEEHAPVNAALAAMVCTAFPGEPVLFLGEKNHVDCVRSILAGNAPPELEWGDLDVAPRHDSNWNVHFRSEWSSCRAALRRRDALGARRLIACCVSEPGLVALKAALWLGRGPSMVIIHSVLNSLLSSRSGILKLAVGIPPGLRLVVLGEHIQEETLRRVPSLKGRLFALPHPYLMPEDGRASAFPESGPVDFSYLGLASPGKGFPLFCRIAQEVLGEDALRPAAARFRLVGGIRSEELLASLPATVELPCGKSAFISQACYGEQMLQATYTVFPYQRHDYELVASGALFDALVAVKPCIALRIPLFEKHFEAMGDIGYLCEDEADLLRTVRMIVKERPAERYAQQCRNILEQRAMFSPGVLAQRLAAIIG